MRKLTGLGVLLMAAAVFFGCSSSGTQSASLATANVSLSDPATCKGPSGPFKHVYIAVRDVKAHVNPDAGDNDSGFEDLTPGLSAPKQVDLLGNADTSCFLAMLGDTQELQAGSYQQIRILLAPDGDASQISGNQCGSFSNCVVLNDGSMHDLELSSEAKTGIKIPSGQIARGSFTIAGGETKDLDVDFNTCESVVEEGNGSYRLKPVLHAGEVSTSSTSINGTVVSSATGKPLVGGTATVALEQKDASGIDRILMTTNVDGTGGFVFCPVPAGTYDLVAVGVDGASLAYSAAVLTGISPGETAGQLLLVPSTVQAIIKGSVTTQTAAPVKGTAADIDVSVLEQVGSSGLIVTIPQVASSSTADPGLVATTASGSCASGTDCGSYTLLVPGVQPNVGAYAANGAAFTQATITPVAYTVGGFASTPGVANDCSPSEQKTSSSASSSALALTPGSTQTAAALAFTGCS